MGRGRKFSKLVMQDNERESRAENVDVDDSEPCPMDTDTELRAETWATMQDTVAEQDDSVNEGTLMQDPEGEDEGVIKDDGDDDRIQSDVVEAELDSDACVDSNTRDQTALEPEPAQRRQRDSTELEPEPAQRGQRGQRDNTELEPEPAQRGQKGQRLRNNSRERMNSREPERVAPEPLVERAETETSSDTTRQTRPDAAPVTSSVAGSQMWQELLAVAAGAEIEAMHWDQAGAPAAAVECYRQVAVNIIQAAESLEKNHAVRHQLEQRATEALERIAALEDLNSAACAAQEARLPREQKAKLTTQGILASTLATTASLAKSDEASCKSSLRCEDAKILGTAATIGGAAGLLLMGPISAACLGAMAAYATTREDPTGATARKVCSTSIVMAHSAMHKGVGTGLKAADVALEESRKRLLDSINGSASAGERSAIKDWCRANKDKCIRAVAAVEAIQAALPRRKLTEEARRMKTRYPDRVPVLCERGPGARSDLPDIERKKFAVPETMNFGEFKYIVHKQVSQAARGGIAVDETIYLFVGEPGVQPKSSATMAELYRLHAAEDGFLCIRYTAENTLGRSCSCT